MQVVIILLFKFKLLEMQVHCGSVTVTALRLATSEVTVTEKLKDAYTSEVFPAPQNKTYSFIKVADHVK